MTSSTEYTAKDNFIKHFTDNKNQIFEGLTQDIIDIRTDAFEYFNEVGFPTKREEDWRFTDLKKVLDPNYTHIYSSKQIDFQVADLFQCDVPDLETSVLTLFNGFFPINENAISVLENGVILGSFAAALKQYPEIVKKHYTKLAHKNDGLVALNTALANDGIFVYIPKNVVIEKPIQIVNIVSSQEDIYIEHRNLFIAEENSSAKVVICDHSLYFNKSFVNSVTEIHTGANAQFDCYRIQNSSNNSSKIASTYVNQEKDSVFTSNIVTLHGGFVRNNIDVAMNGEGCESNLYGLYLTDREQHIDNNTKVYHNFPNCTSREKYKGILDDNATGVFSGRVVVQKDAQKTNAFQSNNNILLTDTAKIDTKPQLEIYADDVKCSHGATVGQLDMDAMFYLQARGIPKEEARMMLMHAFTGEVANTIKIDALRDRINGLLEKRLRGEMSRCNNCVIKCG